MKSISRQLLTLFLLVFLCVSCHRSGEEFDASGAFEAEETIISAEATGVLKQFDISEGQELNEGAIIGYIDTTQLFLKKKQLESQIKSTLSQKPDIKAQLAALQVQLKSAERDQQRIANLVKADAATKKQLDDANAAIETVKRQIEAQQSSLGISSESITQQTSPLQVQIEQVRDQLAKSKIVNPVKGTVLTKYAMANEMVSMGKPLYRIADISFIYLRAYITGTQLSQIKPGQEVVVKTDKGEKEYKTYKGKISWISEKAEFTPKTIQTKEERSNLVYAIKIKVANDGLLKIGMYGEVQLNKEENK